MTYAEMRTEARKAELKVERRKLSRVLKSNRWSPQCSADELEISPSTLYRALGRHPDLLKELKSRSPKPGRKKSIKE